MGGHSIAEGVSVGRPERDSVMRNSRVRSVVAVVGGLVLLLPLTTAAKPGKEGGKGSPAATCFAQMKKLVGDWVMKDESGKEVVALRYKVTAGGSALQEIDFPGSDHEMISMYHMDGNSLVLTHYCHLGNQPHLKMTAASTPQKLVFECAGGTYTKSHDEMHIHRGVVTLKDADHMLSEWTGFTDGKAGFTAKFEVARKK
jgi:hypothetical protein